MRITCGDPDHDASMVRPERSFVGAQRVMGHPDGFIGVRSWAPLYSSERKALGIRA